MNKLATKIAKKDNSYFYDKVLLRKNHLPVGSIVVLDCFAGEGKIWKEIKRITGRSDIDVIGIDINKRRGNYTIKTDNRKFLLSANLSKYNVIDVDAYGDCSKQIGIIFDRLRRCEHQDVTVFFTFIQIQQGSVSSYLLRAAGFSDKMRRKCPTLFAYHAFEYFCQYLFSQDIDRIYLREAVKGSSRKRYGCFVIKSRKTKESLDKTQ
ncbi:MAG: hypothetical protein QME49_04815 [bacterium]|nr:hypothetical protein [bacterium]